MTTLYERLTANPTIDLAARRATIDEYTSNPLVQAAVRGKPISHAVAPLDGYWLRRVFKKDAVLEERFQQARELVRLALTARQTTTDAQVAALAARTLGLGKADASRIVNPIGGTAVILWQGVIETEKDVVRLQLPIPGNWLAAAEVPTLRLFVCYDPPVNEAAKALWACRKVNPVLRPGPEAAGIRRPNRPHESYPLFSRGYKLKQYAPGEEKAADGDLWLLEFSYDEVFDYPPGMDFDSRQRVAIAAELFDRGATSVDPQAFLQALPVATSMTRLSVLATPIRTPVVVRSRGA